MESDSLFEVVEIEGKGLGCIARRDIKMGTLILNEKPQCFSLESQQNFNQFCASVLKSFFSMTKEDQEEFLDLFNGFSSLRAQSFTSLMADLRLNINRVSSVKQVS